MILEKIQVNDTEIHDWESNRSNIMHRIATLEQRGKSHRIIALEIIGNYPYFKTEITELLQEKDDTNNLQKEIQKYSNRYDITDKKIREKMIASLLRK